jgi:hypothetical protein
MIEAPPLVDYGIHTEGSDIRAHVGVLARKVYVFPTAEGLDLINTGRYSLITGSQPGVNGDTFAGYRVPTRDFPNLRVLRYESWQGWEEFGPRQDSKSTAEKGARAVDVVLSLLKLGRFPLWIDAQEEEDPEVQIKGVDILICCKKQVQVKCDWKAGDGHGCYGNLFLQRMECNPLKFK